MGGELSQIDCCLGTDTDDREMKYHMELEMVKKSLNSQKKANRKFRLQKESEIRKYRKRICVLEGERQSLIDRLQNSGLSQGVMTEDMIEAEATMNEVKTLTARRETRESSLECESVAGTSSIDSPPSYDSDTVSIVHVFDDKCLMPFNNSAL